MAVENNPTLLQCMIAEEQKNRIFESLQIGDLVQYDHYGNATGTGWRDGIIIKKHLKNSHFGCGVTILTIINEIYITTILTSPLNTLKNDFITQELLKWGKESIEKAFACKILDNLTYIEILARLNEYESNT